jgi:hypothetical protein
MKLDSFDNVPDFLEIIGNNVNWEISCINYGGCGLFACMVGSWVGIDHFIPVAKMSTLDTPSDHIDGNRLVRPPSHVLLYFEYKQQKYLYDSHGLVDITKGPGINKTVQKDTESLYHFITWESLFAVTFEPSGWNKSFERTLYRRVNGIIAEQFKENNTASLTPHLTAAQEFTKKFRVV